MIERLEFASCYAYSPRGKSALSKQSRTLRDRIKAADTEAFALSAQRVRQLYDEGHFHRFFGTGIILVPVPGRAPLAPGAVSRTQQICVALERFGLASAVLQLLERTRPVPKSAYSAPGERPSIEAHFATLAVGTAAAPPERVLLIDDVVIRGATFLGAASRLRETFPAAEIRAFALVRTESQGELNAIRDPVQGWIETLPDGALQRRP